MDPFLVPELNLFSVFLLKTLIVYSGAEVLFIYAIRQLPGKNYFIKYTPFGEISKLRRQKKHFFANFSAKRHPKADFQAECRLYKKPYPAHQAMPNHRRYTGYLFKKADWFLPFRK